MLIFFIKLIMEFFEHIKNVYSEITDDIDLDLPQAIFMIKLLAIKGSVPVSKKAWEIYMNSDKPLRMRYYLQIKFPEELTNACNEASKEMNHETEYLNYFVIQRTCGLQPIGGNRCYLISDDKRIELYERYFKDKTFDDDTQEKISEWIKPKIANRTTPNYEIKEIINKIIIGKYWGHPDQLKQNMIKFMKRFKDRESVENLLNSMRDVYILGLV